MQDQVSRQYVGIDLHRRRRSRVTGRARGSSALAIVARWPPVRMCDLLSTFRTAAYNR